jgi:tRNA A37 threonylcarbamoyladenosine biosynthesis protein TsaE
MLNCRKLWNSIKGGVVKLNNFAESRVIVLEGDIGSGKSRLIHEFKVTSILILS